MRKLMDYYADKGSLVINGVGFNNGFGDGSFEVFYSETLPRGYEIVNNVWFDLRDVRLIIWEYDCSDKDTKVFSGTELGCKAVRVATNCGDICLVKYF